LVWYGFKTYTLIDIISFCHHKRSFKFLIPLELINKYRNWNALIGNFLDTVRDGTQPILNFGKMILIGDQMLDFLAIQKVFILVFAELNSIHILIF
jgi:hypothetical protein